MGPTTERVPHPVVWLILYLPVGALGGFVGVALTFLATQHGLSITQGALLNGANLLSQWLKWIWAPLVDISLTPKRWYVLSITSLALGVVAMATIPMSPATLGLLLTVIAASALINSVVGMAVESLMATSTPRDEVGRVSAWFQAGNLGGAGLGGGFGLFLMTSVPQPWMAGAVMALLFEACCFALYWAPDGPARVWPAKRTDVVKSVIIDVWRMLKTRSGFLAGILCILPISTGAAQGVLTQAKVADYWGAGRSEVGFQGLFGGLATTVGVFAGGWLCGRLHPRTAYVAIALALVLIAAAMAEWPPTVTAYVVCNLVYAFALGIAYSAFTSFVLVAMGPGAPATKFNVFASLSNFPFWWVGLLLGWAADRAGPTAMLLTEAALGLVGVLVFMILAYAVRHSNLAE